MKKIFALCAMLVAAALILSACTPAAQSGAAAGVPGEGWELFKGDGFEVWLPESFAGGSSPGDMAEVVQLFRDAGQEQMAQSVEASSAYIRLYAIDTAINNPNNYFTNMNVILEQNSLLKDWSIDDYVDVSMSQLNNIDGITVLDSGPFDIAGFDAYWLLSEYDMSVLMGLPGLARITQYLLKNGDHVYVLTYGTSAEEYNDRVSDFETSALSFIEK
ncbi:MAG: hypothetical protein WEA61_05150 [Anaerolineales bacterium]